MKANDLNTKVTNDLIRRMEEGAGTWQMPWRKLGTSNPTRLNGKPYRGINWWILSFEQSDRGYSSNEWGTYNGWMERGTITVNPDTGRKSSTVHVRKDERSTEVCLWKPEKPSKRQLAANPDAKGYLLQRTYRVFNRDQVEGLPELVPTNDLNPHERWDAGDSYFREVGATVIEDGDRAYYSPVHDHIAVPKLGQFGNPDHFYTTLAHEHIHWTGHKSRLDRDLHNRFGSEAYAAEELIAELGAAFWGAQMGMEPAVRQDHAAYLKSWLSILRGDNKAIITAASRAQAAIDHLNQIAGFGTTAEPDESTDDAAMAA